MENITELRTAFLVDALDYYTVDPEKRRCAAVYVGCKYSPKSLHLTTSEGCMIGRKLPDELAIELDNMDYPEVSSIFSLLPDDLKRLGEEFLVDCQYLHDGDENWTSDGLTGNGIYNLKRIINRYDLPIESFSKFLNK